MMATRKASHKMKDAFTDKREKRLLRVHRRSLDQREMRQEKVNQRRQIDDMSPVVESQEASKNPSAATTPVNQKAAESRLARLQKWKEERELKRKIEAMEKAKSKPGFKVMHIAYKDTELFKSRQPTTVTRQPTVTKSVPDVATRVTKPSNTRKPVPSSASNNAGAKPPVKKAAGPVSTKTAAPVTRVTRSRGVAPATAPPLAPKSKKSSPPRKTAQAHFMAPTAASRTRATVATKKEVAPAVTQKRTRVGQTKGRTMKESTKVTTRAGEAHNPAQSFAPSGFVFEAPSTVSSFVFKPLSPASAANFLFPQSNANSTTMSVFTDRVGRTSTPKCGGPSTPSSEEDDIKETRKDNVKETSAGPANQSLSRQKRSSVSTSLAVEEKSLGDERLASCPDSGIVNTKDMDSNSSQVFTSPEEVEMVCESVLPSKSLGEDKTLETVAGNTLQQDALSSTRRSKRKSNRVVIQDDIQTEPEQVKESLPERKRKSNRVAIQDNIQTEPEQVKESLPERKQRRKSRRSAVSSDSNSKSKSESAQDVPESGKSVVTEEETAEVKTPKLASRRSTMNKSKVVLPQDSIQEEKESEEAEVRSSKRSRKSLSSTAPSAISSENSDQSCIKNADLQLEELENVNEANVFSPKRQRSERSVGTPHAECTKMDIPQEGLVSPKNSETSTLAFKEMDNGEPTTPENPRRNLRDRRAKDDMFLTPGPPVSAHKRSTKRRRTATMIALSSAKSPEEAIKIISTSPMVELTRRTPKSKISPDGLNQSTAMLFSDEDFVLEPAQLSSAFDSASDDTASSATDNTASTATDNTASTATDNTVSTTQYTGLALDESRKQCPSEPEIEKRDVTAIREQLNTEIDKLTRFSHQWTAIREATKGLTEEVDGQIRTTVCQAQLLMDKKGKFHQFAGLVDKCEAGDAATTCQDLQGFWDMIFMQAEDIYTKFTKLEQLQQNNWQPEIDPQEAASKPVKKVKKSMTAGNKKDKPVVKSKFAAFKAQMIKQRQALDSGSSIDDGEEKVFDAGFFKINSPVRSPQYHCEAGTPSKRKSSAGSVSTPNTSSKTSTSSAVSPKKMADKENVAHVLLRRSVGATPGRRSFVPTVPSPLLKDGVSATGSPSKASNAETSNAEQSKEAGSVTPVRHRKSMSKRLSTRSGKSVSFVEGKETGEHMDQDDDAVDLTAYLQPSSSYTASPLQESDVNNSPFCVEDVLKHSMSDIPVTTPTLLQSPGQKEMTSLKAVTSKQRRRSRRSVSFAATSNTAEPSFALPSTPYNKSSLVAEKRVTRRSRSSVSEDVLGELVELNNTPPVRRSARPSLLYTPPKRDKSKPHTPAKDVPVATLISFSP